MVSGGQLALGLCHVKRSAVGLCVTCNEEGKEGDDGGDMALEDEPALVLEDNFGLERFRERGK